MIDSVLNANVALKNMWEVTFSTASGSWAEWTTPLVTAINTPKLKLTVIPTESGIFKAYNGYELPDNITVTMYENRWRSVENFLDSWMFGEKGVFDKESGKFRTRDKNSLGNVYRKIRFLSTFWENADHAQGGEDAAVNYKEPVISKTPSDLKDREVSFSHGKGPALVFKYKQQIPVFTALASGVANTILTKYASFGMAIPKVVSSPPVIEAPASLAITRNKDFSQPPLTKEPTNKYETTESLQTKPAVEGKFKPKHFKHEQKAYTTIYTCLLEGYDVASYDYESGGPLSYTVNLSVVDYRYNDRDYQHYGGEKVNTI